MPYINKKNFHEIFEQFYKKIYNYIFYRTNLSREIAEDLTQDIFMKLWAARESYDSNLSSLTTWIFRITKNSLTDYYRKDKGKRNVSIDVVEDKNLELQSTFEDDAILSELVLRMEKLNIEEKEVLILRYINGFEIKEICEIIDKNYDATKVFINRSINKLRKLINEKSN